MALGSTLSIGLAFYPQQRSGWRATWVLTAATCAAIALLSQSRGAAVGLAIAVIVTGGLLIGQRAGDVSRRAHRTLSSSSLPLLIVLSVGFGLAVYSSAGGVADQLGRTHLNELDAPTSKFSAWKSAPDVIHESPAVGVGGGALEPVFTHAFPGTAFATYRHVENEYIEAVIEYGLPGAFVLALLFGWTALTAVRKWRDGPLAAAALGGLAGVAFQSSFDFGIRLIGIAVPVTVVACTLQLVPLRGIEHPTRQRVIRVALVAVLAVAAILLASRRTTTIYEDHEALETGHPTMAEITEAVRRHPLDYFAYGVAGQELVRASDLRAGEVLNHALRLHPFHPGLHRIVARLLISRGAKTQAALEYATAMNGAPTYPLLKEILARLPAASDAALAIPLDYHDPATVLRSLNELKRDDVSLEWLKRRVLDHDSDELELVDKLYDIAIERKDDATSLRAAQRRLALSDTTTSKLKIAGVYYASKNYAGVYSVLHGVESWTGALDERGSAWLLVCDSLTAEQKLSEALGCLRHLDASGSLATRRLEIVRRERELDDAIGDEMRAQRSSHLGGQLRDPVPLVPPSRSGEAIPNPLTDDSTRNPIPNPLAPRHE
ncbi:MAG TPA: O-antigen ligase family protein [Kofleriaceae bacterium]